MYGKRLPKSAARVLVHLGASFLRTRRGEEPYAGKVLIRNVPDCPGSCTVGILFRRALFGLEDVENRAVVRTDGDAYCGLQLQNVLHSLAVKFVLV